MQSNCVSESSASSASSDEPTAVISTSSPEPISSMIACRWSSSSSTISRWRVPRSTNSRILPYCSSSVACSTGFSSTATAPARSASCTPPFCTPPETMCTGMCRVSGWRFRCSSTCQPSCTGRPMSRMIASGLYSWASATPSSPRTATMPLKPRSRAISSSVFAKSASSSTISTTRSPSAICSRSSSTAGLWSSSTAGSNAGAGSASSPAGAAVRAGFVLGRLRRQEERERRAAPRLRRDVDLAAEQAGDLA